MDLKIYQERVVDWCRSTFGEENIHHHRERALRALEECLEAVQAVGLETEDVTAIVNQVYSKPVEPKVEKEIGGALFTMLIFAECCGVDAEQALIDALADAWTRQEKIRQRHLLKHREVSLDAYIP